MTRPPVGVVVYATMHETNHMQRTAEVWLRDSSVKDVDVAARNVATVCGGQRGDFVVVAALVHSRQEGRRLQCLWYRGARALWAASPECVTDTLLPQLPWTLLRPTVFSVAHGIAWSAPDSLPVLPLLLIIYPTHGTLVSCPVPQTPGPCGPVLTTRLPFYPVGIATSQKPGVAQVAIAGIQESMLHVYLYSRTRSGLQIITGGNLTADPCDLHGHTIDAVSLSFLAVDAHCAKLLCTAWNWTSIHNFRVTYLMTGTRVHPGLVVWKSLKVASAAHARCTPRQPAATCILPGGMGTLQATCVGGVKVFAPAAVALKWQTPPMRQAWLLALLRYP